MSDLHEELQQTLGSAYSLERELRGGGMSRVFVAQETSLGRRVVVKVLPPELAEGVSVDRFKREIALAARLQHPHIVPLLSAGSAGALPWFSMPFVEGDSLRDRLARAGELPIAEAVRLLREIASALAYAHKQGVVHRDIKPENVLLSEGTAMVTDFGVAKALAASGLDRGDAGTLTSVGVALGTPAYMAPEQIAADPRTDHRADLYAFGVLAYETLAGRTPFSGRSAQATLAAQISEVPETLEHLRPSVPPALASLVMSCLAKQAADRPQTAQELVRALDVLATTVVTPAGTAVGRAPAARRDRRWWIGGLAVAIAVVVAVFAWRGRHAPATAHDRRVAVLPFANLTGDPALGDVGRVTAEYLAQSIAEVDSVEVVSSTTVMMVLNDSSQRTDAVSRLAAATGARLMVTGSISREGDSLRIQAQLVDTRTGRVARSLDPVHASMTEPLPGLDGLREQLLGSLVADRGVGYSFQRAPKYSAFRAFVAATERFDRYNDMEGARAELQRAIALDSNFFPAYALLAVTYGNRNQWDDAERVTQHMDAMAVPLSAIEREMLEWQHARLRGDEEATIRSTRRASERDSNPVPLYLTGLHASNILKPRIAVPALEASDSAMVARGWVAQTTNLAEAYGQAGMFEKELAYVRRAHRLFPASVLLLGYQLTALAGLRRSAEAIALADTLLRGITDSIGVASAQYVLIGALAFRREGDTATCMRLARAAQSWYAAHPLARPSPARAVEQGRVELTLGRLDSARAWFARATSDTSRIDAAGYLATVYARRGDTTRARAMADSIGAIHRKWTFGAPTFWRGAILGALGDKEGATQLLARASREGQSMRAWRGHPALESLAGYPSFEQLVKAER